MKEYFKTIEAYSFSSITEVESQRTLSSEEFKEAVSAKIKFYQENYSLSEENTVILLHNNSIDFFVDFLSFLFLRVTIIPLDSTLHEDDIKRITDFSNPSLIIKESEIKALTGKNQKELKDTALILFTSGTTGIPKGVLISYQALELKLRTLSRFIPSQNIENSLCFLPTFFGHGLICNSLFPLFYGKKFFIAKKMDIAFAGSFDSFIKRNQINFFSSVPSQWEFILNFSQNDFGQSLKRVHCASAPLRGEKIERILSWLGDIPLYDVYGATEMLGWFAARLVKNTLDHPLFEELWDAESRQTPEGELLIKSSYMFTGYWKTSEAFTDGYFPTGDLFNQGKLIGRSKNVINKNGIKINTDELNALFMKSNLLKDAASFPLEDDFKGEDIGVFIVLKEGLSQNDFKKYCQEFISSNHYPVRIIPIEKIPTNSRNKTSLSLLKEVFKEKYDR